MTEVSKYFRVTDIHNVPAESFIRIVEELVEEFGVDNQAEFTEDMENCLTAMLTYRDSDNYKYPFILQLNQEGSILIKEPVWLDDEEDEIDLFWGILSEKFKLPV